jgi:hypothetical protein
LLRFLVGLACGLGLGVFVVAFYWWRSDQQQAEALEGWEWTQAKAATSS